MFPTIRIDDIDIDLEHDDNYYKMQLEVSCPRVYRVFGVDATREFESAAVRHTAIQGLQLALSQHLPAAMADEEIPTKFRKPLIDVISSENYLMLTAHFIGADAVGPAWMFPPHGVYVDVSIDIVDEIRFMSDESGIHFVTGKHEMSSPRRYRFGASTIGEYGYVPAEGQNAHGTYVNKSVCPRPKLSPDLTKDRAYCVINYPKDSIPPYEECPGFGGFTDGNIVCRFIKPMTAKV